MKYIYLFFVFVLLFVACDDEKIIDDTNDNWTALAIGTKGQPKLSVIEVPTGKIINEDAYGGANKKQLSSAPRLMASFGGSIFLIMPDDNKIEIINAKTFETKHTLDFSAEKKKPIAIAFAPNATTAYLIFEKDSSLGVLDLTVMKVVHSIKLDSPPSSISLSGNQIFVSCTNINKVLVIDTRDNKIKNEISVPEKPVLLSHTKDGLKVVVVSAGNGKLNKNEEKTNAYICLLDARTKKEIARKPLGIGIVKPIEQEPYSLATAGRLYAFIGTQSYLLRFNTRTATPPARLKNGKFVSMLYNDKSSEMIFIRDDAGSRQLIIYNPQTKKIGAEMKLPVGITNLLPL